MQEFTQLDMKEESKNDFMEIIIEFFTEKLAKDNKIIANAHDEVPKDFYEEQSGTTNDTS